MTTRVNWDAAKSLSCHLASIYNSDEVVAIFQPAILKVAHVRALGEKGSFGNPVGEKRSENGIIRK